MRVLFLFQKDSRNLLDLVSAVRFVVRSVAALDDLHSACMHSVGKTMDRCHRAPTGLTRGCAVPQLVDQRNPAAVQFFLGAAGSGAPIHFHCDAWNVVAFGRKRWFLAPPAQAMFSNRPVRLASHNTSSGLCRYPSSLIRWLAPQNIVFRCKNGFESHMLPCANVANPLLPTHTQAFVVWPCAERPPSPLQCAQLDRMRTRGRGYSIRAV